MAIASIEQRKFPTNTRTKNTVPTVYYISGPMSYHKNLNFQAFFDAEKKLTDQGFTVLNPARMDEETGDAKIYRWANGTIKQVIPSKNFDYAGALQRDLKALRKCEGIALLPGWENSFGARTELACALELGLHVLVLGCS